MALYHKDIGFPTGLKIVSQNLKLAYSNHAIKASKSDRYGDINLPKTIDLTKCELIEIEILENKIHKIVARMHYNDKHDISIVLLNNGFVKTVWLNVKTDQHNTLKKHLYTVPNKKACNLFQTKK